MIQDTIIYELLHVNYKLSDVTLNELTDELVDMGFKVKKYHNYDFAIEIIIESGYVAGSLRVDRLNRRFEVSATVAGKSLPPISGDWAKIYNYLKSL